MAKLEKKSLISLVNKAVSAMILKKLKSIRHRWRGHKTQKAIDDRLRVNLEAWVKAGKYALPSTMEEVAEELEVSHEQLRYYFQKQMNLRFLAWRKMLRIQKAASMMEQHPEMSSTHIALECGFRDKSTFRKQFMDIMGASPKDWRARL